ncbi:unnamed protein product [Clavelina lepadiformis]|uniref:Uncharacterized protein n=1 Tax=Clavelina lepadiformis TaxID=159417 RepID=A0ABP0GAQ0_CLALP
MDSTIMKFVEPLGPGQIVDRQSLAALPCGYAKINMYNHMTELRVHVADFQETYCNSATSLDAIISIKGFLSVENEVLKGQETFNAQKELSNALLVFEKSSANDSAFQEVTKTKEILQICVYFQRKNNRGKSFIGMIHISLDEIWSHDFISPYEAAWYKVFPRSSFAVGCPVSHAMPYYVNRTHDAQKLRSDKANFKHMFAEDCGGSIKRTFSERSSTEETTNKKEPFRRIARLILKIIPTTKARKENCNEVNETTQKEDPEQNKQPPEEEETSDEASTSSPINSVKSEVESSSQLSGNNTASLNSNGCTKHVDSQAFTPKLQENDVSLQKPNSSLYSRKKKVNRKLSLKVNSNSRKFDKCKRSLSLSAVKAFTALNDKMPETQFRRSEEIISVPFHCSWHLHKCENTPDSDEIIKKNYTICNGLNKPHSILHPPNPENEGNDASENNRIPLPGDEAISQNECLSEKDTMKRKWQESKVLRAFQRKAWVQNAREKNRKPESQSSKDKKNKLTTPQNSTEILLSSFEDIDDDNTYEVLLSLKQMSRSTSSSTKALSGKHKSRSTETPYSSNLRQETISTRVKMSKSVSDTGLAGGVGSKVNITVPSSKSKCSAESSEEGLHNLTRISDVRYDKPKDKLKVNRLELLHHASNVLSVSECSLNASETRENKRYKFASTKAVAIELNGSNNTINLKFESDDEYASCCSERLSCSNVSTSSYVMASES